MCLSVIRSGELIVAVGAVTAVPLGQEVQATIPRDLMEAAEDVFRRRDPGFHFRESPVEIAVSCSSRESVREAVPSAAARAVGDERRRQL